jgi:hypothetical protein
MRNDEGRAARLRTVFVAPSAASPQPALRVNSRLPPSIAVLGTARDAPALGAAIGVGLARASRAPFGLVCTWTGEPPDLSGWAAPAVRAGRQLVERLVQRGHEARAAGRVVRVALPAEEACAAAEAVRALSGAGDVPFVLVVAGPRGASLDALVREQDHVVLLTAPGAPEALAEIALGGLGLPPERLSLAAAACSPFGRALALGGAGVGPGLRVPVGEAVRAVA